MKIPWLATRLCFLGLLLDGGEPSARAMPFVIEPTTLAEDLDSAHFVFVGKLYNGKPENSEGEGTTEVALLRVIKDHPSLKNQKHLILNRYVPTKRSARYFVLFGEMWRGKVDVFRAIPCNGPKDKLVRYVKDIMGLAKVSRSEELDFYRRHFEHRNPEIAEDAFRAFRKATYADLQHDSKYCDPTQLKRWVADEKVPRHRKELYKVLLVFCEKSRKD